MDLRLKTAKYTINGKEYELCCNMNVLADVQEQNGGDLISVLDSPYTLKSALILGAAMINECCDLNGYPERFTARELGRYITHSPGEFCDLVNMLVMSAVGKADDDTTAASEGGSEDAEKN